MRPKYLVLLLLTAFSAALYSTDLRPADTRGPVKRPRIPRAVHLSVRPDGLHTNAWIVDSTCFQGIELVPTDPLDTAKTSGFSNFINSVGDFFSVDTTKKRAVSFLALPEFSYGDVDGFGLGATARMYINDYRPIPSGERKRQSYIDLSANFTLKGNITAAIRPTVYLLENRLLIKASFGVGKYPTTFRAIGSDTQEDQKESYLKSTVTLKTVVYWRWFKTTYIGLGTHYYDYGVDDKTPGGMLEKGDITGSNGTKVAGLSAHYLYDSRDDQFVPMKGVYAEVEGYFNGGYMGSTENFSKYIVDIRYYMPVGRNQIIAWNFFSQMTFGDVPFQEMANLSNGVHSRGYGTGRYLDKNLMSLQAEYRYYFGRFGVSAFLSTANVGDTPLKAFKMDKATVGGGLRFKPFRNQRMYFRGDIGVSFRGDFQFYLGIDELF